MDILAPKPVKKQRATTKLKSGVARSLNPEEGDEESVNVNDDFKREIHL